MTAAVLPVIAPSPRGRDSQSMALLSVAGRDPLYSGVTSRIASTFSTVYEDTLAVERAFFS